MLPERYLLLLTAYVDGELTPQEQVLVQRLLRRSRRARSLLRQLQHDAQLLRSLPVPALPVDLTCSILQAIADRKLSPTASTADLPLTAATADPVTPSPLRFAPTAPVQEQETNSVPACLANGLALLPGCDAPSTPRRRFTRGVPTWLGVSLAAAVLLAVAAGSFWFFSYLTTLRTHYPTMLAKHRPPSKRPVVPPPVKEKTPPREIVKENQPEVREGKKEPHTTPKEEPPPPPQVQHLSLARLADPAETLEKDRLLQHLQPDRAYHIRLAYRDSAQALDGLRSALRAQGIALLTTQATEQGMRQKKNKNKYLVYIENVQPQELLAMLRDLGQQGQGMHGPIWHDHLAVELLTVERMQQLMRPLGMTPERLQMPPAKNTPPSPAAQTKVPPSLEVLLMAKDTSSAVAKSSAPGQSLGNMPPQTPAKSKEKVTPSKKKNASETPAPAAERQALLLAVADNGSQSHAVIEDFLRRRRPARPGTLRIIILLDA